MARSMSKPFSHFSSTPWAFANPPTPLSAYTFADPPPLLNGDELRHGGQRSHLCRFFVRLQRLSGKKVVFITSTDEHGEKIAAAAAVQGSDPNQFKWIGHILA
ncbi:hypothetical protein SO802_028414 [Lithocarpus litseifolius]|uniref:Methionyl/Leucyl tRNA synthetase domain-containing protein n=1 Tax=Lithocarpus litseifolius TaxID=425828 RepID=A0AAW2BQ84_9ROSI